MTSHALTPAGIPDLSGPLLATDLGNSCATRTGKLGTPALDLSVSGLGSRDPDLYYEDGIYYLFYNRVSSGHYGNPDTWKIGLATGPSLDALTDRGVWFDPMVDATTVAAGTTSASCCTVVKDTAGLYHFFIGAVNSWNLVSKGQIYHYTASSILGAKTFHDVAIPDSTGKHNVDHHGPVFYDGKWRMAYMEYNDSWPSHNFRFVSATSLNGPWTISAMVNAGGTSLSWDAPMLYTMNGRLYLWITGVDYMVYSYDISSLTTAVYLGPVLIGVGPGERGDPAFGSTSCFIHDDGRFDVVYQGESSADGYVRVYAARMGAQRLFVPAPNPNSLQSDTLTAGQSKNSGALATPGAAVGFAGDRLPPASYAAAVGFKAVETSSFTAGEGVRVDGGYDTYSLELYMPALNVPAAGVAIVPINPVTNAVRYSTIGTVGSLTVTFSILHAWRLPF